MICANLNSWEWELRHSVGVDQPPSASCFNIFSPAERAREARADCCRADCTKLYKRASITGQTTEMLERPWPQRVRRADPPTVSSAAAALSKFQKFRFLVSGPSERPAVVRDLDQRGAARGTAPKGAFSEASDWPVGVRGPSSGEGRWPNGFLVGDSGR